MKVLSVLSAVVVITILHGFVECKSAKKSSLKKKSVLSTFISDIETWLTKGKVKDQCFKKRPEPADASKGDSPIESFGFTQFNQNQKGYTKLSPGITLSRVNGFNQPVKIGSRDYFFVGSASELIAFFACFEKFEVIGSVLADDGHWKEKTGSIKLQLQNVQGWKVDNPNPNLFEMLFKITFDRILVELNPAGVIGDADKAIFGHSPGLDNVEKLREKYDDIKKWLPYAKEIVDSVGGILKKKLTPKETVKEMMKYLDAQLTGKQPGWTGGKELDKEGTIIGTLTMYPKPDHNVRVTYDFSTPVINMGDVGRVIKERIEKVEFY